MLAIYRILKCQTQEAQDQMLWVRKMNSIRARAEEIVVTELVYQL
ncbi:TnpV protein [Schaedlerella arabinosiphila]|nr:TnpV protein [Schaedlerella arabinosiphila]